ncbi:hypothetical protein ACFGVS_18410 [Mucilaginibacter sp. AW1-7]|uniref:hypothetical protein n=1 Tax=Mucilaginibacter sp. AW1-7 TaxID=3349874 RepID=UPI003F735A4A
MSNIQKWQKSLLPFMQIAIVLLTVFYLVASYLQFNAVTEKIQKPISADLSKITDVYTLGKMTNNAITSADKKMMIQATFEAYTVQARQQNLEVLLMSRTWIKYLGFITGMILCVVGCTFILGKLSDKNPTSGTATVSQAQVSIKSNSPGLIMAALGTILIVTSIITHQNIEKTDGNIYLNSDVNTSVIVHDTVILTKFKEQIGKGTLNQHPNPEVKRPPGF